MPHAPRPFRSSSRASLGLALLVLCIASPAATAAGQPAPARPASAPLAERVEEYMQAAVKNAHFSGTILIARDGVPLTSRSYGMSNHELQ